MAKGEGRDGGVLTVAILVLGYNGEAQDINLYECEEILEGPLV